MIRRSIEKLENGVAALVLVTISSWTSAVSAEKSAPDFRFEIRPILSKNCFSCHGPDDAHREADLRLDVRDVAINSGAIVPGMPDDSELIRRISSDDSAERMPPEETGRHLTSEEITTLKRWIAEGAPYSRHWAYGPPQRPPLPRVSHTKWCRNEIDYFVLSRLEQAGLNPEPEADRYRLIRRVTLDLTGLPPTLEEVDEFVNDHRPDAYQRVVDRLLASPAYGEHWVSKWLDLARYADTNGYETDKRRTIWPFRNWVIEALNRDMPFDRFTVEQLAGDLLPNPTRDQLIATAFHRNTMVNDEGGTDDEEFRVAAVVDRVNTTMQVWMGTTMGCCQCHSHKFDPLSQQEYYQLFAFFDQTADTDRSDLEPTLATALGKSVPGKQRNSIRNAASAALAQDSNKTPIMQELPPDRRRTTQIHVRGNFLDKGEVVEADTPEVFPPFPADTPRNRLGLAMWLVARNNPLTARVVANRHWEQFFGSGIVLTSEDFGSQGMLPSHPGLLDWLAVELMENGWSLKHLARTIVMSATYRQSSRMTPEKLAADPHNRLMSRGPKGRLTAEQVRDQALALSGLLSGKIGGPSVMPPQPEGVWQMVYSDDRWRTSAGEDRYRRGLYTFWRRTSPYPSAMALDATSRETCAIRRISTNTPVASFALLNDPVYIEAAQALARRIMDHSESDPTARVAFAMRCVLARPATAKEIAQIVELFESEKSRYETDDDAAIQIATSELGSPKKSYHMAELAAWTVVSNVLLNLDETLTK